MLSVLHFLIYMIASDLYTWCMFSEIYGLEKARAFALIIFLHKLTNDLTFYQAIGMEMM